MLLNLPKENVLYTTSAKKSGGMEHKGMYSDYTSKRNVSCTASTLALLL